MVLCLFQKSENSSMLTFCPGKNCVLIDTGTEKFQPTGRVLQKAMARPLRIS
jgi:hypothetical protein